MSQAADGQVRAGQPELSQPVRIPGGIYRDDPGESSCSGGGDAGRARLERRRPLRLDAELPAGGEQPVGSRAVAQVLGGDRLGVDAPVDELVEAAPLGASPRFERSRRRPRS